MTQVELAEKANIGQGYLSDIETGKKTGDVKTLRSIANALGVTLDDVVKEEADDDPKDFAVFLRRIDRDPLIDERRHGVLFFLCDTRERTEVAARCDFDAIKGLSSAKTWNEATVLNVFNKFRTPIEKVASEKYIKGEREPDITAADVPFIVNLVAPRRIKGA
jgi:transcriptional regulator with XRE-family HTH domain